MQELIKEVQSDIPLTSRPFLYLARKTGMSEEEAISSMELLIKEGRVRHFGPIFSAPSFGYETALVAFRVSGDPSLCAEFVNTYPGVSHNYEREGPYNLWFTVAVPPDSSLKLKGVVERMARRCGVKDYLILKAVKTFKLRVDLSFTHVLEKVPVKNDTVIKRVEKPAFRKIDPLIRETVRVSQECLSPVREPFGEVADRLRLSQRGLLSILRNLKRTGHLRKFTAVFNHRKEGFRANILTVWRVPAGRVNEFGKLLSSFRCVSHCYERIADGRSDWHYNLFAMVHARTHDDARIFVDHIRATAGVDDVLLLGSRREFLKRRLKLFTEDFYEWERRGC